MRTLFSLSAGFLLAACASFGDVSEFRAEAPSQTLHIDADYERMVACFMEQPNSGPIRLYGPHPQMEHYPGQRLARVTASARHAFGSMMWYSLIEFDGSAGAKTEVRAFDNDAANLAANVRVIQGCAERLT